MINSELRELASKCFIDIDTFREELDNFIDDYSYIKLFMKRNTKSHITTFMPKVSSPCFNDLINSHTTDKEGLEKSFCQYVILKQMIHDLNVDIEAERVFDLCQCKKFIKYIVANEFVDMSEICNELIGDSREFAEVLHKTTSLWAD
jgi:hypothetical protein